MHWTAGFRLAFISDVSGPPPVMCVVRPPTLESSMNIETRISTLDQKLRLWRIIGPLGLLGVILLYLALAIPLIGSKPTMALCVTVTVGCVVPSLLRWHAFRVERRVLEDLRHSHDVA